MTPRVVIVTNDFPPRPGGIQSFVHGLAVRTPGVAVYAPSWPGCAEFDRHQPYPIVRHPTSLMLPTPAVARATARLVAEHGARTVVFDEAHSESWSIRRDVAETINPAHPDDSSYAR
ncbi:hypothetical protein ABZS51_29750, partial [Nonomuraea sp. NPDC005501]